MKKDNNEQYYDERSAGGIVFKEENNNIYWLTIKTTARKGNKKNKKEIYKFPKGHLKKGEFLKQAALREVEEEGQIKAIILTKLGSNDYLIWDHEKRKKIIKKVTFFLMKFREKSQLKYFDEEEIIDREWLPFKEVLKKLEYPSEKRLLKRAKEKLEKRY
jgi:8-oxo-dGTP pyrophosphatase MutT (NUDIX family)